MKMPVKHIYFLAIESGKKLIDYRDAHMTSVDEDTGRKCVRDIIDVYMMDRKDLPDDLKNSLMFGDSRIVAFVLSEEKRKMEKGLKKK